MTAPNRIMVVDDQHNMRITTALLLRAQGYQVVEAETTEQALVILGEEPVDLLLTDLKMTPTDSLTLLRQALKVTPHLRVIVITAYGSIESAVEAMREGAYDYIAKPFKEQELLHRVGMALERGKLLSTVNLFAGEFNSRHGLTALVGRSRVMNELNSLIARVGPTDATVLIQGESGTGKELVARAIHAQSKRKTNPFVPVNCAAISENLLESELFGHTKGAFTGAIRTRRGLFEEADGGTIFIDEVTETSPAFQSKLLRVLQEGEVKRVGESSTLRVDVRTVAATNRDIEAEVENKHFRSDLFYRLNVVMLRVPPLRDRIEDIPLLAEHFLEKINLRTQTKRKLTASAASHLQTYAFPGNVRELENLVEQAAALSEGSQLLPENFSLRPRFKAEDGKVPMSREEPPTRQTLAEAVEWAERQTIVRALQSGAIDLPDVAEMLGISSTTLWRKMKRLKLAPLKLRG